jgi:uncharacterized protein YjiS (DUF1127 family)
MRNNSCDTTGLATSRSSISTVTIRRNLSRQWNALWRTLYVWHRRARQRRELRDLDDRTLRDIGASRADADFESRKRFWQS